MNRDQLVTGGAAANGYGTFHIGTVNTENADLAEYYPVADKSIGPEMSSPDKRWLNSTSSIG